LFGFIKKRYFSFYLRGDGLQFYIILKYNYILLSFYCRFIDGDFLIQKRYTNIYIIDK
jgi:hypothetical protein